MVTGGAGDQSVFEIAPVETGQTPGLKLVVAKWSSYADSIVQVRLAVG